VYIVELEHFVSDFPNFQLLKFEHCIKNGGGQVVVFGSPESNYKDPKMFENANNLLVQKEPSFVTDPSNQTQVYTLN